MNEVIELAEEEIETTSNESVKAVVAEIGSELAYEKTLREQYQSEAFRLESIAMDLQENLAKEERKKKIFLGIAIGETVLIVSLIAGFLLMN